MAVPEMILGILSDRLYRSEYKEAKILFVVIELD